MLCVSAEIARAPTICLGDKNYKELYILYYIMAFSIGKTSFEIHALHALHYTNILYLNLYM